MDWRPPFETLQLNCALLIRKRERALLSFSYLTLSCTVIHGKRITLDTIAQHTGKNLGVDQLLLLGGLICGLS